MRSVLGVTLAAVVVAARPSRTAGGPPGTATTRPGPGMLLTDDATYRDGAVGKTSQGRDGVTAWKRRTDTGHVRGAPTPFRVPMVTVLRLRGGLIAEDVDHYDVADLLRRSGLPSDRRRS